MRQIIAFFSLWMMLPSISQASIVTNAIQGVGPNGMIRPYLCIQNAEGQTTLALAPGQSGDVNLASGDAQHAQAQLRFAGCDTSHEDLGTITLRIGAQINTPSITQYRPHSNLHMAYINANIDAAGKIMGNIVYTPIQANFNLTPISSTPTSHFVGINLSGLEFGQTMSASNMPNLSQEDVDSGYSDLSDMQKLLKMGVNTVRIPISWSYLQWNGPGRTIINQDYYSNYIKPLLETLTAAKVHVILDLHCNMHYAIFGQHDDHCPKHGYCPLGTLMLDESSYLYVWGQLWQQIQQDANINPDYILLDLANAPLHVPDDTVFTIQLALIKQLRMNGFPGYIIVQGNAGSKLRTWTTYHWMGQDGQMYTNATLFTRANFLAAGIHDLSKILIGIHHHLDNNSDPNISPNVAAFIDYLQENQFQALVVDLKIDPNMQKDALTPLEQFMTYLQQNASQGDRYGFAGWVIWGIGHAWEKDPIRITPESEVMKLLLPSM